MRRRLGKVPQEMEATREAILKFNASIAGTPDRAKAITGDAIIKSMRAREMDRVMKERGLSRIRGNIPINLDIQALFPENTIECSPPLGGEGRGVGRYCPASIRHEIGTTQSRKRPNPLLECSSPL